MSNNIIRGYFNLDTPQWEDLRFPASTINPAGSTNPADVDNTYGWLVFGKEGIQICAVQVQIPHAWKEGSVLRPHIHWMKSTSTSGNVYWRLEYRWVGIGDVMDDSWTTLNATVPTISDGNTQYKHALTQCGDISATGKTVSDMLVMRLSRQSTQPTDTYNGDAILLEFDIHYQVDSFGSNYEYYKLRP